MKLIALFALVALSGCAYGYQPVDNDAGTIEIIDAGRQPVNNAYCGATMESCYNQCNTLFQDSCSSTAVNYQKCVEDCQLCKDMTCATVVDCTYETCDK